MRGTHHLTTWSLVFWGWSLVQQTVVADTGDAEVEIEPDEDQVVLLGGSLMLTCRAAHCDANQMNELLTFTYSEYGYPYGRLHLRSVSPSSLSRPDNCTLILQTTAKKEGRYRYECKSSGSRRSVKRTVRVGAATIGDISCTIRNFKRLMCSCPHGVLDAHDWTLSIQYSGANYTCGERLRTCECILEPLPGCGEYIFNVTRKIINYGFANSVQHIQISGANEEMLVVSNLTAKAWNSNTLGVSWADHALTPPASCTPLTAHYWISYTIVPHRATNNTLPVYLGERVNSVNISDLDPGMAVTVDVYMSADSILRGRPASLTTTLPHPAQYDVTTHINTSMFNKQSTGQSKTGLAILILVFLCLTLLLLAVILFAFLLRSWYRRNRVIILSPQFSIDITVQEAASGGNYQLLPDIIATSVH